jgi:hypothetical protein
MIGSNAIVNARMQGYSPDQVWVHVLDTMPDAWLKQDAEDCIANGFRAQILILPNESVSSLDLSALYGLTVHLMGENKARVAAVSRQCQKFAERILNVADDVLTDWRASHVAA